MNWFMMALQRYSDFSGRSRRKEYWMFALFNVIIAMVLTIIDGVVGSSAGGFGLLSGLYMLAIIVPAIACGIRRMHDTGRSGWWLAIALVPFVGGIIALVLLAMPGVSGPNQYGADPKAGESLSAAAAH